MWKGRSRRDRACALLLPAFSSDHLSPLSVGLGHADIVMYLQHLPCSTIDKLHKMWHVLPRSMQSHKCRGTTTSYTLLR